MPDSESHREDVEQINQIRREFEHAENAGAEEFQRVIEEYAADDVVVMFPGEQAVAGKDACKEMMNELLANFDLEVEYTNDEIVVGDELAFDRGTAFETLTPKGDGEEIKRSVNYLWMYRRVPDGDWKQIRIIDSAIE